MFETIGKVAAFAWLTSVMWLCSSGLVVWLKTRRGVYDAKQTTGPELPCFPDMTLAHDAGGIVHIHVKGDAEECERCPKI